MVVKEINWCWAFLFSFTYTDILQNLSFSPLPVSLLSSLTSFLQIICNVLHHSFDCGLYVTLQSSGKPEHVLDPTPFSHLSVSTIPHSVTLTFFFPFLSLHNTFSVPICIHHTQIHNAGINTQKHTFSFTRSSNIFIRCTQRVGWSALG